jgi:carboxyl-terminal processing protease
VDEKQLIVSTKAKVASKSQDHLTKSAAVDKDIPLAILIDKGSASASEIVAGAIQDLDRGVIVGQRSYGKGLVQNVIPLSYNSQVKITVAKYYIPSGRCIQAIDYFNKDENGNSEKVPDSLIAEFKTKNGRLVYDGGGIEPDVSMEPMKLSKIAQALITKYLLFDYANLYASKNSSIPPANEFEITDAIYDDMIAFLKDKNYDYQTASEEALEKLKASAKKDNNFDVIEQEYNDLKAKILHNKSEDLLTYKDEIKMILKDEIVGRYYYQKGRIVAALHDDPEIARAVEVLQGNETYLAILDGTMKPPRVAVESDDEEE